MIHVGCGNVYLDGWINIDISSERADVIHDAHQPFPYEDHSIDFIYSEHFIEHLTADEGVLFFKEMHRILKNGGVMRTATSDLGCLVFRYLYHWKEQEWITKYGYSYIKTKAEMLNTCFYEWGHKWIYNFEELERRLCLGGFNHVKRLKFGKSAIKELQNLEIRADSKLIVETKKRCV